MFLSYKYEGYYGSFKKKYLVPLVDYVVVALRNPTFCYYDEVGKHSEVTASVDEFHVKFANQEILEKYYTSEYDVWNMNGDYGPYYSEEAKKELCRVFDDESPEYNPEKDDVPDPKEFIPLIERVLVHYPMRTVLVWKNAVKTDGKPEFLHISIDFTDAREAALFIANSPKVEYFTWRNKEKRYDVDIARQKHPEMFFEDDTVGTDAHKLWKPDEYQWDQLQKECAPGAEWEEMICTANSVVRQKRLKQ